MNQNIIVRAVVPKDDASIEMFSSVVRKHAGTGLAVEGISSVDQPILENMDADGKRSIYRAVQEGINSVRVQGVYPFRMSVDRYDELVRENMHSLDPLPMYRGAVHHIMTGEVVRKMTGHDSAIMIVEQRHFGIAASGYPTEYSQSSHGMKRPERLRHLSIA